MTPARWIFLPQRGSRILANLYIPCPYPGLLLIQPRLAIYLVLRLVPGGILSMGPDCSSWTVVSRGTSWRSFVNFAGNESLQWIRDNNLTISRSLTQFTCSGELEHRNQLAYSSHLRCTLLLMLATILQCLWVMEQPSSSEHIIARHRRFEKFCNHICWVPLAANSLLHMHI